MLLLLDCHLLIVEFFCVMVTQQFYFIQQQILVYIYLLIFAVGNILSLINYFGLKSISKLYSVFVWSTLLIFCTISTIILEMQIGYTLSWSIYFDAFVTLSFSATFIYIMFLLFFVSSLICIYNIIFVLKHECKIKK